MRLSKRARRSPRHRMNLLDRGRRFGWAVCSAVVSHAAEPDNGLDVVKVRPNFYMIAGAGGNISVQIGVDGVVLVNSGNEAASNGFWPRSVN